MADSTVDRWIITEVTGLAFGESKRLREKQDWLRVTKERVQSTDKYSAPVSYI